MTIKAGFQYSDWRYLTIPLMLNNWNTHSDFQDRCVPGLVQQ